MASPLPTSPEKCKESDKSTPSNIEETDGVNVDALLPLLEPPGDFEAWAYYWALPSQPKLLGRTSSGTVPWWRLSEPHKEPYEDLDEDPISEPENDSVLRPIGPHAIKECWQVSTSRRVCAALKGLPWDSVDLLRIGRASLTPRERPVVVWVGVSPKAIAEIEAPWDLIASKLRAVRAALDADNLTDVECEIRTSEISR
ncbi:hypothetical protein SEPCBS57363_004339 [Sporothrix epigloea]|uniref:Uncharacterized protein n=1 Tax=Sporothrix epigloea TaxID=1892477 RepID=A0ABP0DUE3_9PEZI